MKLSFTTLGCPSWDLHTILTRAVQYGFQGIDFRGYLGEMAIYRRPEFAADREDTAAKIRDAGLELCCFSSGAGLMPTEHKDAEVSLAEVQAYAELCPVFGTPYIRVFGHSIGERTWGQALDEASENLTTMARIAGEHGASVLLETHDAWVNASHIRELMQRVEPSNVGVVWDVHHPWRAGETPEQTWRELKPWVRYTHWKDAALPDHKLCLMGDGDLPLQEFFQVLRRGRYEGYYALEWEKKHHPELADPEVAFPGYVRAMNKLERQAD